MHPSRWSYPVQLLGLATAYAVAARIGLSLAVVHGNITLIWPPSGIALAALLLWGLRLWPGIALGVIAAGLPDSNTPWVAMPVIAAGNTSAAICGASLLRRVVGQRVQLNGVRAVTLFIVIGAVGSTLISATIGAAALCLTGNATWTGFVPLCWTWWLGDGMGVLIVTPVMLAWGTGWPPRPALGTLGEAVVLLLTLVFVNDAVFTSGLVEPKDQMPYAYLPFPVLMWAALRFGQRGTALAILVTAGFAVVGTVKGHGPFATNDLGNSLMRMWVFLSVFAVTTLLIAAAMRERLNAAKALTESESLRRSINESAPVHIMLIDLDGTMRYINHTTDDLTIDEVIGTNALDYVQGKGRQAMQACLDRVRASGKQDLYHTDYRTRDGKVLYFETRVAPWHRDGQMSGFILCGLDITARKQAQDNVRQREHALRTLADNIPGIVARFDRDLRHLFINQQIEKYTDIPAGAFLGKANQELGFPAEQVQQWNTHMRRVFDTGEAAVISFQYRFDNGDVHFESHIVPEFGADGRVESILCVTMDVSERHRSEQALRESREHYRQAAEQNRRLVDEVNHRVRNNLASMISLVTLIEQHVDDVHQFAGDIQRRLLAMAGIHNLLAETTWQTPSLRTLLTRITDLEAGRAPTCRIELNGEDLAISQKDAVPLMLTFAELFTNSIKHGSAGSPGGVVDISWSAQRSNHAQLITLHWREQGGPPIQKPPQPSLGTDLIRGFINYELAGSVKLNYPTGGVAHELTFRLIDPDHDWPPIHIRPVSIPSTVAHLST